MTKRTWNMVGQGNLGSILAARLSLIGESVRIVSHTSEMSPKALISVTGKTEFKQPLPNLYGLNDSEQNVPAIWVIPVKAWQVEATLNEHKDALSHAQAIVFSHNGLGASEHTLKQFEHIPCYDWVTTHGGFREEHSTEHSGYGESWIGPKNQLACEQGASIVSTLSHALPLFHWDSEIQFKRWNKLAINCAINGLATLAKQANGALLDDQYREPIQKICEEVSLVANHTFRLQGHPYSMQPEALLASVYTTLEQTRNNTNSMLQDIQAKRKTEIEYLNGFIIKKGQEYHIPTPTNLELYERIKAL